MKRLWLSLSLLGLASLIWCTKNDNIAGGTNTGNAHGQLVHADGSPAAGVKVMFYPVDNAPRQVAKIMAATDSTTTDANGEFATTLDSGTYNMLAATDSTAAFQDSITTGDTTIVDTMKTPGSLRARVQLQGDDNPRTVFVLVMGTNIWAGPDAAGDFALSNMAEGTYNVRILTTLDLYEPLDTVLAIRSAAAESLSTPIQLKYTGIPVPTGLSIQYDTLKQIVTLTWNKPTTGRTVASYTIYRKRSDSITAAILATGVADTVHIDSTLRASATYEYRIAAVDTQNNGGTQSAPIAVVFQNRLRLVADSTVFGPRGGHTLLAYSGKMWLIGGSQQNDVWSTTDGIDWTRVADSAAFSGRSNHTSVVFNNEMWVIGGTGANGLCHDVWHSTDGANWVIATDSAGFGPRMMHASVVFQDKIWVIGGGDGVVEKNDVWQSTDGITWSKVTENAGFSARAGLTAAVLGDAIYITGGSGQQPGYGYSNDAWSSTDGISWTQVTANGGFPGTFGPASAVFKDQFWLICGEDIDGYSNAIWSSSNGTDWKKFNTPDNFTAKNTAASVVFDNKIWIVGQAMQQSRSLNKTDVWYLK